MGRVDISPLKEMFDKLHRDMNEALLALVNVQTIIEDPLDQDRVARYVNETLARIAGVTLPPRHDESANTLQRETDPAE